MFPIPETNAKIFCCNEASGWGWKRIAVHNRKRRLWCAWYTVTSGLGIRTADRNEQDLPVPIDLHSGPLMEHFALLGVKLGVGALVEDPWLGSFPPGRGKRHLPWFHKTCVLPLDLHHDTCGMFNFYLVGVSVDGIGYSSLGFVGFFKSTQFTVVEISMETNWILIIEYSISCQS